MKYQSIAFMIPAAILFAGCERKPAPPASSVNAPPIATSEKHDHGSDHEPEAAHGSGDERHDGVAVELGSTDVNGMNVRAARDQGEIVPGGEAPIDVWINGGLGNAALVRFWIGAADARGSIKAKAQIEDGKWHTHAEVPDPMPADSKLWIEIEVKDGRKFTISFDLRI